MTSNTANSLIARSKHAEFIRDLYIEFGDQPFTYNDITDKFPDFKKGSMMRLHLSKVIEMESKQKRACQTRKGEKNYWKFTPESIKLLKRREANGKKTLEKGNSLP